MRRKLLFLSAKLTANRMTTWTGLSSALSQGMGAASFTIEMQVRCTAADLPWGIATPPPMPVCPMASRAYRSCLNASTEVIAPSFFKSCETYSNTSSLLAAGTPTSTALGLMMER